MKKSEIDEILDDIVKNENIDRRDVLKMMAAAPLATALFGGTQEVEAATSDATGKIVIVGGGLSGIATAAKLSSRLKNPDITIIEPNPNSVAYQPGTSLVVSGTYTRDDIWYETADFMPEGVEWIKKSAKEFDPQNNAITLDDGSIIKYDYLVVAMGITLNYGGIEGLVGETTTSGENSEVRQKIGKNGVHSLYFIDGSVDAHDAVQELIEKAKTMSKKDPKLEFIFTDSPTAIKCGGAPKKIAYIVHDLFEKAGVRDRINITCYTNSGALFGVKEYAKAIEEQFKERKFAFEYKTRLVSVDSENKIATFERSWIEKGKFDEDLGEYDEVKKTEKFTKLFDFLHVVPLQSAPKEVADSPLGSPAGWVPADQETMQHVTYKNVFALGDCAAVPLGKTGGSARKQYKVVAENLIALMEGKSEMPEKYDGYTVCPLITRVGRVMFAEFDWSGKPAPSFPLDPTKERWTMWLLKAYLMKPMVMYGMLPGRV